MIAPSSDPRWERLRRSIALEPVDKVPVCLEGVAWCARVLGMPIKEFLSDPLVATQANIDSFELVGNADCASRAATSPSSRRWPTSRPWPTRPRTPRAESPTGVRSGAGRRPQYGRRRPAPLLSTHAGETR
jgi:hypothetical protein